MADQSAPTGRSGARRRFGLRTRITLAFGLGALLLSALLAGTSWGLTRENLLRQRDDVAQRSDVAQHSHVAPSRAQRDESGRSDGNRATRADTSSRRAPTAAGPAPRSGSQEDPKATATRTHDPERIRAHADAFAQAAGDAVEDAVANARGEDRRRTSALAKARALRDQGDLDGALDAAREALRAAPPDQRADAQALLASLQAARARRDSSRVRADALAHYRRTRTAVVERLAALDAPAARTLLATAEADPDLRAIADTLALDRADVGRIAALRALVETALRAKLGAWVSLAILGKDGALDGRLREEGDAFYVRLETGALRAVRPGALSTATTLALARAAAAAAATSSADPDAAALDPSLVAALRCVRADDDANAALDAWHETGAPTAALVALEAKRVLAKATAAATKHADAERRAALALRRADRIWERANTARESKRKKALREAARAYERLLGEHGETDAVKARRPELQARIERTRTAAATAVTSAPKIALLRKLLHAKIEALPNGRTRCTYRFDPKLGGDPLQDWRTVDTVGNRQLRDALEQPALRADTRAPAPYDRTTPWTLTKDGLLGTGWDRLVWKARLQGDAALEIQAIPLHPRNIIVTVRDDGARDYYGAALTFSLPTLPALYRASFPDLYALFDRWQTPQNTVFRSRGFPDLERLGQSALSPLPRRRLQVAVTCRERGRGRVTIRLGAPIGRVARGRDPSTPPAGGSVGLAAWNSAVLFERVVIEGVLDPAWVEAEAKRRGLTTGSGSGAGTGAKTGAKRRGAHSR